jgi:hypothetical protein
MTEINPQPEGARMMHLQITIHLDNAAFEDTFEHSDRATEISRILFASEMISLAFSRMITAASTVSASSMPAKKAETH